MRLSGQLLLGLVRLYLRKLQFLEEDAGLALRGLNKVCCPSACLLLFTLVSPPAVAWPLAPCAAVLPVCLPPSMCSRVTYSLLTPVSWMQNAAAGQGGPTVDLPDGGVAPELAITLQDSGYDPMAQFVGNELFPSFESSLYGEADGGAYGGGASVTVAQDISELFGSRWTGGVEDRDGGALERRFRWGPAMPCLTGWLESPWAPVDTVALYSRVLAACSAL